MTGIESRLPDVDKTCGRSPMENGAMSVMPPQSPTIDIGLIDRLARAVFIWVRQETMQQRFDGLPVAVADQCALAAGFLAGLRTRAGLSDSELMWVAYVYALMSGERKGAIELLDILLAADEQRPFSSAAYLQGLHTARTLFVAIQGGREHLADNDRSGCSGDEAADQVSIKSQGSSVN